MGGKFWSRQNTGTAHWTRSSFGFAFTIAGHCPSRSYGQEVQCYAVAFLHPPSLPH